MGHRPTEYTVKQNAMISGHRINTSEYVCVKRIDDLGGAVGECLTKLQEERVRTR